MAGNPIWGRSATALTYGGHPNKRNWGGFGVVNPRTDVGAEHYNRLAADAAAIARVSKLCTIQFTDSGPWTNAGGVPVPVIAVASAVCAWGAFVAYDGGTPPTLAPKVELDFSDISTPTYKVTLPASVADDFGTVASILPQIAIVNGGFVDTAHGQRFPKDVSFPSANVLQFRLVNAPGSVYSSGGGVRMTIEVW